MAMVANINIYVEAGLTCTSASIKICSELLFLEVPL